MKKAFLPFCIGLAAIPILFAALNNPRLFDSKSIFHDFTGINLSEPSSITRFRVRNFFPLDGPDYYYELNLSKEDASSMIHFFEQRNKARSVFNGSAMDMIPDSWRDGSHDLVSHYYLLDEKSRLMFYFDLDAKNNKAWLVIQTL